MVVHTPALPNILPSFLPLHFSAKPKMLENVNSWAEYLHGISRSINLPKRHIWIQRRLEFFSTLLFPVSLLIGCWDWVQGGNPLYAAVKCLSGCWGQIWRNFSIFFAKRTWHTHFLTGKFFSETKNNFFPPKLAVFRGSRHFSKIEGPFSEIEGPGFERMWPLLLLSLINNTNNY